MTTTVKNQIIDIAGEGLAIRFDPTRAPTISRRSDS